MQQAPLRCLKYLKLLVGSALYGACRPEEWKLARPHTRFGFNTQVHCSYVWQQSSWHSMAHSSRSLPLPPVGVVQSLTQFDKQRRNLMSFLVPLRSLASFLGLSFGSLFPLIQSFAALEASGRRLAVARPATAAPNALLSDECTTYAKDGERRMATRRRTLLSIFLQDKKILFSEDTDQCILLAS